MQFYAMCMRLDHNRRNAQCITMRFAGWQELQALEAGFAHP